MGIKQIDKPIWLENDIIRNPQIDDDALIAYIGLRTILCNEIRQDYIAYDCIAYAISKQINNRKLISVIKKGINTLTKVSLITCLSESNIGKELQFDRLIFDSKSKHFTIVYQNEIYKILNSDISCNIAILRYFIITISTLNHSKQKGHITNNYSNVGNQSIQYRADMAGISKKTAIKYDKWLEDNQLLYIARSDKAVVNSNGAIEKSFCNHYGRCADRQNIDTSLSLYENNWGANIGQKNLRDLHGLSKESKSLIAKMTYILKGKEYSIDIYKQLITFYGNRIENEKTEIKYKKEKYDKGIIGENEYNDTKNKCIDSVTKYNQYISILQSKINPKPCKIDIDAYFKKHIGQ